ncbi:hypothetical protein [Nonomuraea angiospora]|uniref:hypothetical protein n=1 Tax=Nonomuraea TaxID=83681 RepID=UPI00332A7CB7
MLTDLHSGRACGRASPQGPRPLTGGEYELAQAGQALADLAARRTVGKIILRN